MAETNDKPEGLAVIICDNIITDPSTNKKTLFGLFNNIIAPSFPVNLQKICIFVTIYNGNGKYNANFKIIHSDDSEAIYEAKGPVKFEDPNHVVEMGFIIEDLVFPKPGIYSIEFYCDEELISDRRFTVNK